mmetsp:Transcript_37837/g.85154  ORF Transcript_37837/g.85154 Transcript_37837/m.85154 type:complete len:312 (+) Transcript_37837:223-1158(+)
MELTTDRRRRWKRLAVVVSCLLTTAVVLFAANWIDDSGGASNHDHERETSSNKITGERRIHRSGVNDEATPPGRMQRLKGSSSNHIAVGDKFAAGHRSMHFIIGYKNKKTKKVTKFRKTVKKKKKGMIVAKGTKKKAKQAATPPPPPINKKPKPKPKPKPPAPKVTAPSGGIKPSGRKPGKKPKGKPFRPGKQSNKSKDKPAGGGGGGKPSGGCNKESDEYKKCCKGWDKPNFNEGCISVGCRTEDCPRFALSTITAHTGHLCTSEKQKRCCLGNTRPDFEEFCLDLGCAMAACIHHVERDHLLKIGHGET